MSEKTFSPTDIEKIAELASLELTEAEKTQFADQFQEILTYFKKIDEAPVMELHDHDVDSAGHLREDTAATSDVSPESFSWYLESGHFKVPKVIE